MICQPFEFDSFGEYEYNTSRITPQLGQISTDAITEKATPTGGFFLLVFGSFTNPH